MVNFGYPYNDLVICKDSTDYLPLQGRPQDLGGGGPRIFFFRFGNLHVAKRHAVHGEAMRIARGVRGHAPQRKIFKTVQFGAF